MSTPSLVELSPVAVQTILAGCFLDSEFFGRWGALLTPDFWGDTYYNRVARFLYDYYAKYGKVPDFLVMVDFFASDTSLSEEDREVYAGVFDTLLSSPLEDLPFYTDHLKIYIRARAFRSAMALAEEHLEKNRFDAAMDEFVKANLVATDRNFGTVGFFTKEAIEARCMERLSPVGILQTRIPLQIGNLDYYLQKGLRKKTLSVFVGATGFGKTQALIHVAKVAVTQGFKAMYVSLELDAADIADRLECACTGMTYTMLAEVAPEIRKKMQAGYTHYGDALRIISYPEYSMTPDDLSGLIDSMARDSKFQPDLLLIDYADLMKSPQRYHDRRFEFNAIYTLLHKMAKEKNLVVVTATQTNREGMNKPIVRLADIAEDISKAWISDHIFSICQTPLEQAESKARIFIAKNRSGAPFKEISFQQDYSTCRFALPLASMSVRTVPPKELET